jgi:23S rRNA pseudouridine2605 synthase
VNSSSGNNQPGPKKSTAPVNPNLIRLNKYMADSGLMSRREADTWIQDGRVSLNGKIVTELGLKINPQQDKIQVDGKPLHPASKLYYAFHKPKDTLCAKKDPQDRRTIYDWLPPELQGLDPVGRLDRDSTGLLLLSNDGEWVQKLTHPKYNWVKVYQLTVSEPWTESQLDTLGKGILLQPEGKLAQFHTLEITGNTTAKMALITGYNRQIRRMMEAVGQTVTKLKRIQFGPILLKRLEPGGVRPLIRSEHQQINTLLIRSQEIAKAASGKVKRTTKKPQQN